jgi:hypothetical protein
MAAFVEQALPVDRGRPAVAACQSRLVMKAQMFAAAVAGTIWPPVCWQKSTGTRHPW